MVTLGVVGDKDAFVVGTVADEDVEGASDSLVCSADGSIVFVVAVVAAGAVEGEEFDEGDIDVVDVDPGCEEYENEREGAEVLFAVVDDAAVDVDVVVAVE